MSAAELIADLADRGIALRERSGSIFAVPAGEIASEERALIRKLKAELIELLEKANLPNQEGQEAAPPSPAGQPDPRQLVAAEGLRSWGAAGGPGGERREVAIELPDDLGVVHVVPERSGLPRCETTWAELAADPLGTAAGVRSVLEAVRELGGRIAPPRGDRGPELARWDPDTSRRIAWLEGLDLADLPPAPFRLDGHRTVTDPARFLAGLREAIADGPGGALARSRALQADLAALEARAGR